MKEETVLAVIKSQGLFQVNPLSDRDAKATKLLRSMAKKGLVVEQRSSPGRVNFLPPPKKA
jgi:hypothetical protein